MKLGTLNGHNDESWASTSGGEAKGNTPVYHVMSAEKVRNSMIIRTYDPILRSESVEAAIRSNRSKSKGATLELSLSPFNLRKVANDAVGQ